MKGWQLRCCLLIPVLVAPLATAETPLIDPSEVAPGTRGRCITEMDGGELVELAVTVLGTTSPVAPEGEMVLVRLEDERFKATGIIAGMSGSPVYIEGRLLGALAFGWPFAREPIGGVTPFSRMLPLADGAQAAASAAPARPALVDLLGACQEGRAGAALLQWLLPRPVGTARRLPLAMSAGGISPESDGWLGDAWQRLGWTGSAAMASTSVAGEGDGGGSDGAGGDGRGGDGRGGDGRGGDDRRPDAVVPGSMVAAVLVEGDATFTAAGTVTEVRGDQVWAFGHPFLGSGATAIPMAAARVVTVMPSLRDSFKFVAVGGQIGAFEADRERGIWGRLGRSAPMVPVQVNASGHQYRFRCLRHPVLLPLLTAFLTESSHRAHGRSFGNQTVTVRLELRYAGLAPVLVEETYSGPDAALSAAGLISVVTAFLEGSSYAPPDLEAIGVELAASERTTGAELIDVVPERTVVHPGEQLAVRVRLRPYRGEITTRWLPLEVPQGLAAGRLDLIVAAGGSWTQYDLRMRPFRSASFADELALVRQLRPSTRLVAALERQGTGISLRGGHLAAPPSMVLALRSGLGAGLGVTAFQVVQLREQEMPFPVVGALRIPLEVRLDGPKIAIPATEGS